MQRADDFVTVVRAPLSGVIRRLGEVPDAVFAEGMLGAGTAIEPLDNVVMSPFDGVVVAVATTGHSITLRASSGVELLIHVGIDTVALNHAGFEVLVAEGQIVAAGEPLIRLDLDYIATHARDLLTPIIVVSEGYEASAACADAPVRAGDPLFTVRSAGSCIPSSELLPATAGQMTVVVSLPHGIHARPAARISRFARGQAGRLTISCGDRVADARSTTELMKLGVACGNEVGLQATGDDADAMVLQLAALLREMGEAEAADEASAPRLSASPDIGERRELMPTERRGVRAAPGLATGPAAFLQAFDRDIGEQSQGQSAERAALDHAVAQVRLALQAGASEAGEMARQIAEAHLAVLDDTTLNAEVLRHIDDGRNAALAWRLASRQQENDLALTGNARLKERAIDFRDVERRVIRALLGEPDDSSRNDIPDGAILICDDLQPSFLMERANARIAAICCANGGPTSHAALLSAAAGIPMVVSLGPDIFTVKEGMTVAVDADSAIVDLAPSAQVLARFTQRTMEAQAEVEQAAAAALQNCHLADGHRIEVFANLASVDDARAAVEQGAEGCGLLRTEFLFAERADAPTEAEQVEVLGAIAGALDGRPLIVRTLDVGGDKPLPYFPFEPEENPALGMRGIRFSLRHEAILRAQLGAILDSIPPDSLRIMLPMVVDEGELLAVRAILNELVSERRLEANIPLGIMVETPSAALLSDQLAAEADFLSIGSNDLCQYVLAMDRANSGLADRVDGCHPAVLRAIDLTAKGAAAHGRWLGICGGLASEPDVAPLLVGLGCVELSAVPRAVPAIKQVLRRWTLDECTSLARAALQASSATQVRALLAGARK